MRSADAHLTPQELQDLLFAAAEPNVTTADRTKEREAQQHLDGCDVCKGMARKYAHADSLLRALGPRKKSLQQSDASRRRSDCPPDQTWLRLDAGLIDDAAASQYVSHAAGCDRCGPLLKEAMEDFAEDITVEEEAAIGNLDSAGADWQREMGRKLAAASGADPRLAERSPERSSKPAAQHKESKFSWWPRFGLAATGIVVVAVAGWLIWQKTKQPDVNSLLAQAYGERRNMELRIAGAPYARLRLQRGGEQSLLNRPEPLLKAANLIATNLNSHPSDPSWLQAKAKADLLDGNSGSAIVSLQRALEAEPDSPLLLTDLASAYFQQAEAEPKGSGDLYGKAIETLSKALSKAPDDPVALFNRAIVCERLYLYGQAMEDWGHYLRVDPNGPWADEARQRRDEVQQKLKEHDQSLAEPLFEPSRENVSAGDEAALKELEERFEQYLEVTSTEWLPKAYPVSSSTGNDARYREALHQVAEIARQEHGDFWLTDLMSATSSPGIPKAVAELSNAIRDNDRGDNIGARKEAAEADRLFAAAGNLAGALRARVEYLFASHDAQQGKPCLQAARGLSRDLAGSRYRWLTIQFHIELGTCYGLAGDFGMAERLYSEAAREAEAARYAQIFLRTQDHLAGLNVATGNLDASWEKAHHGLKLFWQGRYPAMRGYNFYYNLYECARITGRPYLQMAAWRDGLAISDSFRDNVMRAMAHSDMADAAVAAGEFQVAEQEFARATQLFAEAPQIKSTRIARIEAETRLAEVETAQNKPSQALTRLRALAPEFPDLSDTSLPILFYTTLGEAESRAGEQQRAEGALNSAIYFAESKMRSLRDEGSRFQWSQATSKAYRTLVEQKLRRGEAYGSLEIWEWYRGADLRAGQSARTGRLAITAALPIDFASAPLPQPHEVAAEVPNLTQSTVVTYMVLPQGLGIWVYDNRGVHGLWIDADASRLAAMAGRFRSLCADPHSEEADLRRNARSLYGLLIAPIDQYLDSNRSLVIEADEVLSQIPFGALVDGQGRFLGDRAPMTFSLGIYYRRGLHASEAIVADSPALIATVSVSEATVDPPPPALPDASAEGDTVAARFVSAMKLSGPEATVATVRARMAGTRVFHFAGHAVTSAKRTGLLLYDAVLDAPSLRDAQLSRLQLAVLSACDTQGASAGSLYDADGLVRTFLRSGVPHVVASRWNVDSDATRQFMELFYRSLLSGHPVAESIRRAQAELRSLPGRAHPYYWSAFATFGAA
jgi:CHAT domain-containing protein